MLVWQNNQGQKIRHILYLGSRFMGGDERLFCILCLKTMAAGSVKSKKLSRHLRNCILITWTSYLPNRMNIVVGRFTFLNCTVLWSTPLPPECIIYSKYFSDNSVKNWVRDPFRAAAPADLTSWAGPLRRHLTVSRLQFMCHTLNAVWIDVESRVPCHMPEDWGHSAPL